MTKKNVMPIAVLTVICLIVAILLAVVNYFTKDQIALNADKKVNESLYAVLDSASGFDKITVEDYDGRPKSIADAYKDKGGTGYVIVLETSTSYTSGAAMSISVGVGADGVVKGVQITSYSETKDFGKETYPKSFVGLKAEDIDTSNNDLLVSGVTYSSKAFKAAVKDALDFVAILGGAEPDTQPEPEVLPRTDEEIASLASQLVGAGASLEDVTPEERDLVKRVYKDKGGKGYVAYLLVMSQYGTPETETLVHFTTAGKIAGVNKLVWKTSEAMYGYVPPTEEVVDAFYAKLAGNNSADFEAKFEAEGAELVSGATSTSTKLVKSIAEAFDIVDDLILKDMPTDEETVKSLAAELVGGEVDLEDVTPENRNLVKKIYKDKGGKGYIAYLVVISQYGTPETETLVHFTAAGKIAGVKKMIWKTSDAMYGYVPPAEDVVDAFYAKLPGNNSTEFAAKFEAEGAELVSGATSTSTKLVSSIREAFDAVTGLILKDMPTDEETVKSFAAELMGGEVDLERIEIDQAEYVRRLYRDKNGKGYVAYLVVISSYGTPETETLVFTDNSGKIVNVKKITWKTSDAMYGYVPPTEEVVDAFYAKLPGNTLDSMKANFTGEGVELVTNATNTSGNLVKSIIESLEVIESNLEPDNTPRIVGIVILATAFAAVAAITVIKYARRRKVK